MTVTLPHDGDDAVRRSVLPGGLRIVTESLPAVRSAAIGIWASVGSRDEDLDHAGATHYLEHLLFKGDGAMNQGVVHEAMNMAGLWKLPVVYIVENNLYAMTVSLEKSVAVKDLAR